ncbi:MAG TPA: GNAT family N-acetyltransferase [Gaiellaceae bacterium]|nr:GNAT family N-acetyltransferase [Gaiellaceae bacterium]
MKRALADGYELDDDRVGLGDRLRHDGTFVGHATKPVPETVSLDVDAVHDYLANHSYWAEGRPRETVERLVREAARVVGLYRGGRQVGFARAVSDGVAVTYLADVYVLPEHRGSGLGVELVREIVENGPLADRRWLLHTRDAHDLYRRLGFGPPGERLMERPPA